MTGRAIAARPASWGWAALGAGAGSASLLLAAAPTRWQVAALAGLGLGLAALASAQPRRMLLGTFVLSLQLGLVLYLTPPLPPTSTGASWPSSLSIPLPALAGAVAAFAGGRRDWSLPRGLAATVILLILTTAVSVPGSPVRFIGLSHTVLWAVYFLVLVAATRSLRDAADLRLALRLLHVTVEVQSLVYCVQYALGATFTLAGDWIPAAEDGLARYGGSVSTHPAAFASFLVPLLLLVVAEFLLAPRPGGWRLHALLIGAGGATLAATFTRAAWTGFGLGLAYLLVAGARRRLLRTGRVWLAGAVLVAVAVALAPAIVQRLAQDHREAFEERWALSRLALEVVAAHPLTGVGAGAYPFVMQDYVTPDLAERWLWVVHNVYLLRAAETGLPGLAAWLLFLAVAFRLAAPERIPDLALRPAALGWRAGLVALTWEMLWDVSLGPSTYCLLWFLCGWMLAARRVGAPEDAA